MSMCNIPIHIRLSERWLVDPAYNAEVYHKREDLTERFKHGGKPMDHAVPESVLKFIAEATASGEANHVVLEAAGALKMDRKRLNSIVCNYRRFGGSKKPIKYEELTPSEIKKDVWLRATS